MPNVPAFGGAGRDCSPPTEQAEPGGNATHRHYDGAQASRAALRAERSERVLQSASSERAQRLAEQNQIVTEATTKTRP